MTIVLNVDTILDLQNYSFISNIFIIIRCFLSQWFKIDTKRREEAINCYWWVGLQSQELNVK